MSEQKSEEKGFKEISPIDVYQLLPKTNCEECGFPNCMAFATKVVNREVSVEECSPLLDEGHEEAYQQLKEMMAPAIKEIVVGKGDRAATIGGKLVMYRHEFAYFNPTAIALDVTDQMDEDQIVDRVKKTENFNFNYIGQNLTLDMIAVRSTSNDPDQFKTTVNTVVENTDLPLILCSLNPDVLEAGLTVAPESRSLLYAATENNWKQMAEVASQYNCPLTVFSPGDIKTLKSLTKTLLEYGVEDLVLDPGTFPEEGLNDTLNSFTMIRRSGCKQGDELLGFPILGVPMMAWMQNSEVPEKVAKWREAYLAAMMIVRYADVLIMHNTDGWSLLPNVVLRQNIYTDPREPVAVDPGLRTFGDPDEDSPVMMTTNFALTYYTVSSDIESGEVDGYLVVVDTGGIAVDCAVAGRKLTAENAAEAIEEAEVRDKVQHEKLIIPGKAARLSGKLEQASGWEVLVGPQESSEIPKFLKDNWP